MRGPLNLKFANNFIIYQKRRFGTDRLHSELWDWGVKIEDPDFRLRISIAGPKSI